MDGKLFTWGYRGRGLLGRTSDDPRWAGIGMQVDNLGMLRVGLTKFQKEPLQGQIQESSGQKEEKKEDSVMDFTVEKACCGF